MSAQKPGLHPRNRHQHRYDLAALCQIKRGELFKIDLQLIQDNQKRHNGELFKIKFAVV